MRPATRRTLSRLRSPVDDVTRSDPVAHCRAARHGIKPAAHNRVRSTDFAVSKYPLGSGRLPETRPPNLQPDTAARNICSDLNRHYGKSSIILIAGREALRRSPIRNVYTRPGRIGTHEGVWARGSGVNFGRIKKNYPPVRFVNSIDTNNNVDTFLSG